MNELDIATTFMDHIRDTIDYNAHGITDVISWLCEPSDHRGPPSVDGGMVYRIKVHKGKEFDVGGGAKKPDSRVFFVEVASGGQAYTLRCANAKADVTSWTATALNSAMQRVSDGRVYGSHMDKVLDAGRAAAVNCIKQLRS